MEDSPLSILASITGILTFFAAIVGFVFVRYKVLQNGTIEMDSILATTVTVIDDSGVWLEATKDTSQNEGHPKLWNTFRRELFKTELQIVTEYHAAGLLGSPVELVWVATMSRDDMSHFWQEIDTDTWLRFDQIVHQQQQQRGYRSNNKSGNDLTQRDKLGMTAIIIRQASLVWRSLLNLGASPSLLRWYRIRENVLDLVRSRKALQSRLLLYQVSTANS
jgi:hypothetical protein